METKDLLQNQLENHINRTMYEPEWGIYFIKELVGQTRTEKKLNE